MTLDFVSVGETADNRGISSRMVNDHCVTGRIPGVQETGNIRAVPQDA